MPLYDRQQEAHYNLISALHKSVRGSDPDAALYWLARMLQGGEDPRYIARRLVRMACEDIGLADPAALPLAIAASQAYEQLGSPEGELALAECALHLALRAQVQRASTGRSAPPWRAARESGSLMPPSHILNAPTRLMKDSWATARATPTTTMRRTGSPARTIFPTAWRARASIEPTGEGEEAALRRGSKPGRSCAARRDPAG